jgi:hypothetical protein
MVMMRVRLMRQVPADWLTTWRFTSRNYRHLLLRGSKRETIGTYSCGGRNEKLSQKSQGRSGTGLTAQESSLKLVKHELQKDPRNAKHYKSSARFRLLGDQS